METFRFKQSHDVARGIFLLAFALMCRMSVSAQNIPFSFCINVSYERFCPNLVYCRYADVYYDE